MINMDLSKLAPEISALLIQRGSGVPALIWHDRQVALAKETLDQIDDAALFGGNALADDGLAAAVRSLLYLWNGWLDDSRMYAQAAGELERHYIAGFCDRQMGNGPQAKHAFQQFEDHPIYAALAAYMIEAVGAGSDVHLRRVADIVNFGQTWEPFAFIDLFEQGRVGKLCRAAEEVVCSIQCREFELLFDHCYRGCTGRSTETDEHRSKPTRPKRRVERSRRSASRASTPSTAPQQERAKPSDKPPTPRRPGTTIGVLCPKCRTITELPTTARGRLTRCDNCKTTFMVPAAKPGKQSISSAVNSS